MANPYNFKTKTFAETLSTMKKTLSIEQRSLRLHTPYYGSLFCEDFSNVDANPSERGGYAGCREPLHSHVVSNVACTDQLQSDSDIAPDGCRCGCRMQWRPEIAYIQAMLQYEA